MVHKRLVSGSLDSDAKNFWIVNALIVAVACEICPVSNHRLIDVGKPVFHTAFDIYGQRNLRDLVLNISVEKWNVDTTEPLVR